MFNESEVVVIAIVFMNRMTLFKVDEKDLRLEDLMIKYQLKNCRKIHKVKFTKFNEVIFSGDNGQLSIISFNSTTLK